LFTFAKFFRELSIAAAVHIPLSAVVVVVVGGPHLLILFTDK
jgi:hypothetical protein